MKKIITLVLALVLIFTMSVSVFATGANNGDSGNTVIDTTDSNDTNDNNYTGTNNVTVNMTTSSAPTAKVYYVVVEWAELAFTYNFGEEEPVWDPTTHKYKTETPAGSWDKTSIPAALTVANHSNNTVTVTTTVDDAAVSVEKYGITLTLSSDKGNTTATLETADTPERIGNYGAADKVVYDVAVSGTPTTTTETTFIVKVVISHS